MKKRQLQLNIDYIDENFIGMLAEEFYYFIAIKNKCKMQRIFFVWNYDNTEILSKNRIDSSSTERNFEKFWNQTIFLLNSVNVFVFSVELAW